LTEAASVCGVLFALFRRQTDDTFTVSFGNRENILLILSKRELK